MRVTNGIPLGSSLLLPVHTVNCVQTLKVNEDVQMADTSAGTVATSTKVTIAPRDSYHRTVYIGELGLQIRSEAGTIASVQIIVDGTGTITNVSVVFDAVGEQPLSKYRLKLIARSGEKVFAADGLTKVRGAYDVPTGSPTVTITW
jgi:hypothetical protein